MEAATGTATNTAEWSVGELSGALKRTLEDAFGHVRVRGEISGYRGPHSSGHAYFCLKDRDARLDGVVWRTAFAKLRFKPQEGLEVVATGRITTFPGKSTYQLVIETLEPAGAGALMALLDERRKKLAAEGLFGTERKRRPPFLPGIVGVVTSPTGAVIRDILHRLEDRFPRRVLVWPVRVQGETSGPEVAAAIAGFGALAVGGPIPRPDVVIVARGGGSIEDLWGFNDEAVVRAAVASPVPVISAVGHETDWTLLDHAADLRAPTPTGAAEMAVPVRSELLAQTGGLSRRLGEATRRTLDLRRAELRSAARALPSPESILAARRQRLDLAAGRLAPGLLANARDHERRLRLASDRLAKQRPDLTLARYRERLRAWSDRLEARLPGLATERAARLAAVAARLGIARDTVLREEANRLGARRDRVRALAERARRAMAVGIDRDRRALAGQASLLASLGYRAVLERGYVLVRGPGGRPVARASELLPGEVLALEFADGVRSAVAEGVKPRRRSEPLAQATLFDN